MVTEIIIPPTDIPGIPVPFRRNKAVLNGDKDFDTIQDAVDQSGTGDVVVVGAGTFSESVTVTTDDLTLIGSGRATVIDGGTTGTALTINANDVTVKNLEVKTTQGGGNLFHGVILGADSNRVKLVDVTVSSSDGDGIGMLASGTDGDGHIVDRCVTFATDGDAFSTSSGNARCHFTNCKAFTVGDIAYQISGNQNILSDCIGSGAGTDAYVISGDDVLLSSCVADSPTTDSFDIRGDSIRLTGCDSLTPGGSHLDDSTATNLEIKNCIPSSINTLTESTEDVLADDGKRYSTIQEAENAATSWIKIPPGTFSENVTIDTAGLVVMGAGDSTIIDGGTTGSAIIASADGVEVKDVSLQTTGGGGTGNDALFVSGADFKGINITILDSDDDGIVLSNTATDAHFENIDIVACDDIGFINSTSSVRTTVIGMKLRTGISDQGIVLVGDDGYVGDVQAFSTGGATIDLRGNDCVANGGRISGSGDIGIRMTGTDQLASDFRVSGSATSDLDSTGATTPTTDSIVTGAAN